MIISDKKKKTLSWLLLSTSITAFSIGSIYAQDLVPGPGEQEEDGPIFYVPQSQMTTGPITDAYAWNGTSYTQYFVSNNTNIYSAGQLIETLDAITTGSNTLNDKTITTSTTVSGSSGNLTARNSTFNNTVTIADGAKATLTEGTFQKKVTVSGSSTATVSGGTFNDVVALSGTATAKVTGTTTFAKKVTAASGTTLVLGDNNSTETVITFKEGLDLPGTTLDLKSSTKITIPAGHKLKISANGTVTVTGSNGSVTNITGDLVSKASSLTFSKTTIAGDVALDPSLFTVSGANTITQNGVDGGGLVVGGTLTLGSTSGVNNAIVDDSNNVILFNPGGSLTVTDKVILHNENALIVGYYPSRITPQGATTLLTTTNGMVDGANNANNKTFNYVFTLALKDNNDSTGILQPIDATVTNNDSTYKFNIAQTATGVTLSIDKDVEATAGSDMSAIITQLLNDNNAFKNFVKYDASSSGYSARASNVTNALIGAFEGAKNGSPNKTSAADSVNTDEFRFKPVQLGRNQNTLSRTENILKAIADNGPINLKTDEGRVWIAPFTNLNNSTGESAGRDWMLGSLIGAEYRDLTRNYTIGIMGGANFGHSRDKGVKENGSSFTGVNGGCYGSYGAWKGGRFDAMYLRSVNFLTESRLTDIGRIARNQHKLTVDIVDLQTSHVFKFPDNWSLRFNLGHTYTHDNTDGYTETGAAHRNKRISSHTGRTYEAYTGVGLRWDLRGKEWRTRITGVYEYGQEYKKKGSAIKISHGSALNVHTFQKDAPAKNKTHYTTLYATVNNTEIGWKFYLGYNGTFTKNSIGTGLTFKTEYRF
jgi:hypothetical protein